MCTSFSTVSLSLFTDKVKIVAVCQKRQGSGELLAGGKIGRELVLRPIENERGRAGLDTHVPLRFTASGQGLLPLLRSLFGQQQNTPVTCSQNGVLMLYYSPAI
ncbi:hypothetical protein A4S05_05470 [Nostoc sp. KVJ20]|nr:hypothetical protein A4S05_05470 [Nostoc sp. KVJ20]